MCRDEEEIKASSTKSICGFNVARDVEGSSYWEVMVSPTSCLLCLPQVGTANSMCACIICYWCWCSLFLLVSSSTCVKTHSQLQSLKRCGSWFVFVLFGFCWPAAAWDEERTAESVRKPNKFLCTGSVKKSLYVVTLNFHDPAVLLHWKDLKMLFMQDLTEWMLNITWLVHTLKTHESVWNFRFFFQGLEILFHLFGPWKSLNFKWGTFWIV